MKRPGNVFVGAGLVCALVVVLFVVWSPSPSASVLTASVTQRDLRVRVHAVGELDALQATVINSRLRGNDAKIIWIIDEGTRVQAGDVLVRLDPKPFEEIVEKFKDLVAELEAKVDAEGQLLEYEKNQVEQEVEAKQFELRTARIDLNKLEKGDGPLELARLQGESQKAKAIYQKLRTYLNELDAYLKKGALKEEDVADVRKQLDEAKLAFTAAHTKYTNYSRYVFPSEVEKAKATVAKCQLALDQAKKGGGFRIGKAIASLKMAKSELENARTKLARALEDLGYTVLRAPIQGMAVLKEAYRDGEQRKPRVGDTIMASQPLVYLPDVSKMVVKTQVREIDLHKVAQGKTAVVRVDAYPELTLEGKVSTIGVLGKTQEGAQGREKYFTIEVVLDKEEQRLRPGMTARVEIVSSDVQGLAVPVQSIFQEDGVISCFVEDGSEFVRTPVVLGSGNEHFHQILSGVMEGDRVALTRPDGSMIRKETAEAAGFNG